MKKKTNNIIFLIIIFITVSCDFSSLLHRKILGAQKHVLEQKYDQAVNKYEEILKDNPKEMIKIKIYYQLGELYSIHLSDNKKALNYYGKIRNYSQDPLWQVKAEEKMGNINFNFNKDFKSSVENYRKLSAFRPKLKRLDFYEYRLGISYFKSNSLNNATKVFNKIQGNTNHKYHIKSFYQLGLINFQKKEWKMAIAYWNGYIKREPRRDNIVQTKFLMANAYETMENLKRAYDLYYSILGEYPNTKVVQNRLNAIYNRKVARKR